MSIVWEDPPPAFNNKMDALLNELRARPNEWARLPRSGSNVAGYKRQHHDFEFTSRSVDGKQVLYGRYVGS